MKFTKRRFYHESDRNYRLQAWNDLCHNSNSAHDSCHMYSCTIIYPDWAGTNFTDKSSHIYFINLAIYLSLYLLGWKRGTISYLIYLLIGLVGIPVFSGFTGGPAKLAGPTGGYIIGFIAMAIIAGLVIDHFHQPWLQLIGMIVGTIICYVLGTAWFCFEAKSTVSGALSICVLPFIPGDLIKMIIAMLIGPAIKKRLR